MRSQLLLPRSTQCALRWRLELPLFQMQASPGRILYGDGFAEMNLLNNFRMSHDRLTATYFSGSANQLDSRDHHHEAIEQIQKEEPVHFQHLNGDGWKRKQNSKANPKISDMTHWYRAGVWGFRWAELRPRETIRRRRQFRGRCTPFRIRLHLVRPRRNRPSRARDKAGTCSFLDPTFLKVFNRSNDWTQMRK